MSRASAWWPAAAAVAAGWLVAALAAAGAEGYERAPRWLLLANVLLLLPLAAVAAQALGTALGGRLPAVAFPLALVLVPPLGALYALSGYRDTYVDRVLPEAAGLADSGAYAAGALQLASAALLVHALATARPRLGAAALAGTAAGVAALAEPSAVLFLVGPALACAVVLRPREAGAFAAAAAPLLLALALWRGGGWLDVSWAAFEENMAGLREHLWSNRLLQWLPVAGVVALLRRSPPAAVLLGGWFGAFALSEGASPDLAVRDGSFLVAFVPALPAFACLLAALPLLVPALPRRLERSRVAGP